LLRIQERVSWLIVVDISNWGVYIRRAGEKPECQLVHDMERSFNERTDPDNRSDDLIWMLQSRQVSQRFLIEELVSRYYQEINYLAYTILEDDRASSEAAQRTLANAVNSARTLREDVDLDIWLYKLAWENIIQVLSREWYWRKLEKVLSMRGDFTDYASSTPNSPEIGAIWEIFERKLAPSNRRLVVLHCVHRWSANKISQIVGAAVSDVQMDIDQSWQIVYKNMDVIASSEQEVRNSFTRALLFRWDRNNIPPLNQEQIVEHICLLSGNGSNRRNLSRLIKDAMVLLIALITIAVLFWAVSLS